MSKLRLYLISLTALFQVTSCTGKSIEGKKLYLLNASLDAINIMECELNFVTNDKVEIKQTLLCNSFECLSITTTPEKLGKTIIREYSYKDDFLHIDGLNDLERLTLAENGTMETNTGETLYSTSVTQESQEEKEKRLLRYFKGNRQLSQTFLKLMDNRPPRPLIERKDGNFIFH